MKRRATEAYLLAGFDSDASDKEDEGWDGKVQDIPAEGKKKVRKLKDNDSENEPGVIYIGRIPHGFFENEMRGYFGQFGEIVNLRLSRNKRTGASKHFAFIEFASKEVAKIAAETMNNYMIFQHILKCQLVPKERLHADTFVGANKKFRKIPHEKIEREKLAAPKSVDIWQRKNSKEQRKRDKKARELKEAMGYDAPQVVLKDPTAAIEEAKLIAETEEPVKQLENGSPVEPSDPVSAIEAPKEVPEETNTTELSVEVETNGEAKVAEDLSKKAKKQKKKSKKSAPDAAIADGAEASTIEAVSQPAIESTSEPAAQMVKAAEDTASSKPKKDKKKNKKKGGKLSA